ncbi:MAG TPA: hypothetical protein VFW22_16375 [Pseudolabrys sp.]|nr:hypothetical protein [Pseudolabrys sp.]
MGKQNQIAYFHHVRRPNGEIDYYWKPTRKWRDLGYRNIKLPDTFKAAAARAIAINEALPKDDAPPPPRDVKGAIAHYKAGDAYKALKPGSKRTYDCYLRAIDRWATDADGKSLHLSQLTRERIEEWRTELNADTRHHRRVDLLRILGVFLQHCEDEHWLPHPGRNLRPNGAPARKERVLRDDLQLLVDGAAALEMPHIATAVPLGFYTMQRGGDLRAATGFKLRDVEDISAEARRILAGPDGRVLGLFLEQEKTTKPVGISLVPESRAVIDALGTAAGVVVGTHLIPNPAGPGPCPKRQFQRDFRAVVDHVCAALEARSGSSAALGRLQRIQFRDLRRSGMCWMRDLGVSESLIAANSGHSIEETRKILAIYMPRDTRAAAEGLAMAVREQAKRDAADRREARA